MLLFPESGQWKKQGVWHRRGGHADLQHPRQHPEGAVQLVLEPGLLLGRGVLAGGGIWQSSAGRVVETTEVRDTAQGWHLNVRWDEG